MFKIKFSSYVIFAVAAVVQQEIRPSAKQRIHFLMFRPFASTNCPGMYSNMHPTSKMFSSPSTWP